VQMTSSDGYYTEYLEENIKSKREKGRDGMSEKKSDGAGI